jgi:hypothetical protein
MYALSMVEWTAAGSGSRMGLRCQEKIKLVKNVVVDWQTGIRKEMDSSAGL